MDHFKLIVDTSKVANENYIGATNHNVYKKIFEDSGVITDIQFFRLCELGDFDLQQRLVNYAKRYNMSGFEKFLEMYEFKIRHVYIDQILIIIGAKDE